MQNRIALEGGNVLVGEQRGVGIVLAWLREWKKPLDEVVDFFQIVVKPSQDVLQKPTFGVGFQATMEVHKARHEFPSLLNYFEATAWLNASRNASGWSEGGESSEVRAF